MFAPVSRTLEALGLCALLAIGCQQAAADLREWRPSDHTNTGKTGAAQKGQVSGQATATPNALGVDQVILSTWQNNCVSCHGRAGLGDGPQAPMYQPRDLGDPAFQAGVTDQQLLESIQRGKGKMPGFALPENTAQGLVRLVRLLSRQPQPAPSGTAGEESPPQAAGSGSAPSAPKVPPSAEGTAAAPRRQSTPTPAPVPSAKTSE